MFSVIDPAGKTLGPVSARTLELWFSEGRITAETPVRLNGRLEWVPYSQLNTLLAPPVPDAAANPKLWAREQAMRAPPLELRACLAGGWGIVRSNMARAVTATLAVTLCMLAVGLLSPMAVYATERPLPQGTTALGLKLPLKLLAGLLEGVFLGGLVAFFLRLRRGQRATLADAFSGFLRNFVQLGLVGLLQSFLVGAILLASFILGFLTMILLSALQVPTPGFAAGQGVPLFWVPLAFLYGLGVPVVLWFVTHWLFAIPLVVDRDLPFHDAMRVSRIVVSFQRGKVFGLLLLLMGLPFLGLACLGVGVLLALPLHFATLVCAHETLFGDPAAGATSSA